MCAHLPHIFILFALFRHFLHPSGAYLCTTIHYVLIVCFLLRNKFVYVGAVSFSIFGAGVTVWSLVPSACLLRRRSLGKHLHRWWLCLSACESVWVHVRVCEYLQSGLPVYCVPHLATIWFGFCHALHYGKRQRQLGYAINQWAAVICGFESDCWCTGVNLEYFKQ